MYQIHRIQNVKNAQMVGKSSKSYRTRHIWHGSVLPSAPSSSLYRGYDRAGASTCLQRSSKSTINSGKTPSMSERFQMMLAQNVCSHITIKPQHHSATAPPRTVTLPITSTITSSLQSNTPLHKHTYKPSLPQQPLGAQRPLPRPTPHVNLRNRQPYDPFSCTKLPDHQAQFSFCGLLLRAGSRPRGCNSN
jgi:hypothetical protein